MTNDCLSIIELLDLRLNQTGESSLQREHVEQCPRCAGLFRRLPELGAAEPPQSSSLRTEASLTIADNGDLPGQIWCAHAPDSPERRYVVVVLGHHRRDEESIVVAPTSTSLQNASEFDLLVEPSPLPYRFMVSPWNFGVVVVDQLDELVGRLPPEALAELLSLYRSMLGNDLGVDVSHVGPSISSSADERLIWRAEEIKATKPLYAPWARRASEEFDASPTELFSNVVRAALVAEGHDESSLAEYAHVSASSIAAFLDDRLDLTDQEDIEDVVAVVRALHLSFEQVEASLRASLHRRPGGQRIGRGSAERLAARRRPDISAEEAGRLLRAGLSEVDDSDKARELAIASYVNAVANQLS